MADQRPRSPLAAALAALAMFGGAAYADQRTATEWLDKAVKASRTLNVTGVREVAMPPPPPRGSGGPPERPRLEKLVELYSQRGSLVRIDYPASSFLAGQVILESPTERQHYFPSQRQILTSPARREGRMEYLVTLVREKAMRVEATAGERVAGRETTLLVLTGEAGMMSQRLWVDVANGFVLKRELSSPRGRVWSYQFTQVDYKPKFTKKDFDLPNVPKITPQGVLKRLVADSNGEFKDRTLKAGAFRLESANVFPIGGRKALVQTYSGSSGRVTLFQLNEKIDGNDLQRIRRGANLVSWEESGRFFVLVGSLPEAQLRALTRG